MRRFRCLQSKVIRVFHQPAAEMLLPNAIDDDAARQAADLMALRQRKGRPVELRDTMIAGIVLAANAPWLVPMLIRQKAGNGR